MQRRGTLPLSLSLVLLSLCQYAASQAPSPGHRIYQVRSLQEIRLVDAAGSIVHRWSGVRSGTGGIALHTDGTVFCPGTYQSRRGVQRVAFDGTVLWRYGAEPGLTVHHDLEVLPNGHVLLIAQETWTSAEVTAQGRNPAYQPGKFQCDSIIEVEQTELLAGAVVWEWHARDHLIQDFDPQKPNYGVVAQHPERIDVNHPAVLFQGEFTHANGIDYDPIHDWIVLSSPVQNEIWIIDHGTTSAEAAGSTGGRWGKGGDLLYRWGNPAAYRAGNEANQQLFWQHDPEFVLPGRPGAGHVTVFNNRYHQNQSQVVEIALPVDASGNFILNPGSAYGPLAPVWTYTAPGFFSDIMSSAQRLPNGNTLICSAQQSWLFEVTAAGQKVWEHYAPAENIFNALYTQRSLWADPESLPAAAGGVVHFGLVAGSASAGDVYVLLGSASGTAPGFALNGVTVPLNPDGYLTSVLSALGTGPFATWVGTLDASGGASARYTLPPLPALVGLTLHHAMLTIDASGSTVVQASNAVPLVFQK